MSATAPTSAPSIYPCLSYRDASAAIEWLTRAFGCEVLMNIPGPTAGSVEHAELRLGNGVIMLGSVKEDKRDWLPPRELPGYNQALYVVVDDVDAHCARARAAGAEIVMEPTDQDYGSRDYGARDPEGHHWFFGTYVPRL